MLLSLAYVCEDISTLRIYVAVVFLYPVGGALQELFVKGKRGRSKSRGPKRDPETSSSFSYYFCKKPGHIKKNCMKYKEILKTKGRKNSDRVSTNGKSDQAGDVKEANKNSCDILTAESEKGKYSDVWLLDSGAHTTSAQKREWFSTYKSYDGGSILMRNDIVYKIVGICNIHMRMFDGQV